MSRHVDQTVLFVCCIAFSTTLSAGELWNSFQNGGAVSTLNAPESGSSSQFDSTWETSLTGYGQSSPVVWGQTVYVTSVSGEQKENYHIAAYETAQGKKLWQHDLKNATPQKSSTYVSRAAPSPTVDESGLYAFFEGGNLLKLSHDGKPLWERNLVEQYGPIASRHGLGASLEQDQRTIYVWVERTDEPYVLAIEKATGEVRWKSPGVGATSWASPRLVPVNESESHLVLSAVGSLRGLDPKSGEMLWTFDGISGNSTPTPMPIGNGKFLIGATVGRDAGDSGRAAESNGLIQISKKGAQWQAGFVWQAKEATSSFGSPIVHAGRAYFVNKTGVLFCLDAESGEELARQRMGGSLWATPVASGDRVFLFQKDGILKVYSSDNKPKQLAELTIFAQEPETEGQPFAGRTLYAAVPLKGSFLVRSGSELVRLSPKVE